MTACIPCGPEVTLLFVVCSVCRAGVGAVVSRGEVRGGPTSEASGATSEEPAGPPGDSHHLIE